MPGVCGAVHGDAEVLARLERGFVDVWPDAEIRRGPGWFLAAHAHGAGRPIHDAGNGSFIAVDGDASVYDPLRAADLDDGDRSGAGLVRATENWRGSAVVCADEGRRWTLAAERSGTFVLYLARTGRGFAFSSHLRPLARAVGAHPDPLGIAEYTREGYTIDRRSLLLGVERLLPGERVTIAGEPPAKSSEFAPHFWEELRSGSERERFEQFWDSFVNATRELCRQHERHGVMLSAGWDSRIMLAGFRATGAEVDLRGYMHGDLRSREARIVRRLARTAGIPLLEQPLTDSLYDLRRLQRAFGQTEFIVTPAWIHAAITLREAGAEVVSSGLFGEFSGGRYGPALLQTGWRKMVTVGSALLGLPNKPMDASAANVAPLIDALSPPSSWRRPWFLSEHFWNDKSLNGDEYRSDVEAALKSRLDRGTRTIEQTMEWFLAENRFAQDINGQIRSCRGELDAGIPLIDPVGLRIANSMPFSARINNKGHRLMLRWNDPRLLRPPTAAVLLPGYWPIPFQELSRVVRKSIQENWDKLYYRSNGRIRRNRMGWTDFEFLRESSSLETMVRDLKTEIWDTDEMLARIRRSRQIRSAMPMHGLADMIGKFYNVDLMLR